MEKLVFRSDTGKGTSSTRAENRQTSLVCRCERERPQQLPAVAHAFWCESNWHEWNSCPSRFLFPPEFFRRLFQSVVAIEVVKMYARPQAAAAVTRIRNTATADSVHSMPLEITPYAAPTCVTVGTFN